MYNKIRNKILNYKILFNIIHFLYTPIRIIKEFFIRRKMANIIIKKYNMLNKNDNKIFYFGIPEHNNLGDMAQTYCIRKWLAKNYLGYTIIEIRTRVSFDKKFIRFIKKILGEKDIFIFQSGYCTRDKNADHLMHKNIMKQFSNQKAIILPQTVKLKSNYEIKRTKKIFFNCRRLLFIARDKVSYEQAKLFVNEKSLELFPDIVTSLIGTKHESANRKGVLICVRNDTEKFYTDKQIDNIINQLLVVTDTVEKTDTNSNFDVWETYKHLEKIINQKIMNFSKYKVIITDRYHGTIFSLIANTPVIVVKTNDHKVVSGVEWFKGTYDKEAVHLAEDLETAVKIAMSILKNDKIIYNNNYFYKVYYEERLKERIEAI